MNNDRTVKFSVFPTDYNKLNDALEMAENTGERTGYDTTQLADFVSITATFGSVQAKNQFEHSIHNYSWVTPVNIHLD